MADNTQSDATKTQAPSTGMRGEIEQRWGKFSAQEITALKDKERLGGAGPGEVRARQDPGATRRRCVRKGTAALVHA